jgi:dipeptidyl aminopeptidase/acylaminoacyl peptidase
MAVVEPTRCILGKTNQTTGGKMYTLDKFHKHVLRIVLLLALATPLAGCFDLAGQEAEPTFDSPLLERETDADSFDSPLPTPTTRPTPYVPATPTTPPFPTPIPTPVVTPIPTAQPPIIPLPSEPESKPFTLVFPDGNVIRAVNSDGSDERVLLDVQARLPLFLASERTGIDPWGWGSVSPDGGRLALVFSNVETWDALPKGERFEHGIYQFDLATGDLKLLVQDGLEPVWSPDGTRIAYRSTQTSGLWIVDVSSGETREIYAVDRESEHYVTGIDWAPDGKRLVFLDEVFRQSVTMMVISADGAEPAGVLASLPTHWPSFPKWSPDGNEILFISPAGKSSGPLNDYNLWVMNSNGTNQIQLTQDINVSAGLPSWSPDGHWIAFTGTQGYEELEPFTDLWLVDKTGSELKRLTFNAVEATNEGMPAWSPDGTQIIFDREGSEVWIISLIDGVQTKLPSVTFNFITLE